MNEFCRNCHPTCKKEIIDGLNHLTQKKELHHFRMWETKSCNYKFNRKECSCGCKRPERATVLTK